MNPCQPAGITPASLWTAPGTPTPIRPAAVLVVEEEPSTGRRLSLDGQGHPILATIGVQLRTRRGSGESVLDEGSAITDITKNNVDTPALIAFELQRMLKPLVDDGRIIAGDPDITAGPDAGNVATTIERVQLLGPEGGGIPTDPR